MTDDDYLYLIWSHEHSRWWCANRRGYTQQLSEAGRYTRPEALAICARAIPGTAQRMGVLPELPVRLADLIAIVGRHQTTHPDRGKEPWL